MFSLLDPLILFALLVPTVFAGSCFTDGGSNTTLLDPTCAGGSATLVVEKDKPWVVDFKPDQLTGGQNQLLTFIFGGCLVNASYIIADPPNFKIDQKMIELPLTFTVQADKVVAKGANNKEVDVSCTPKIESAGDGSGRSKIVTNYSAADPANAKGFSAVYNAPIFVPKETESAYTSTWAIVGYCVIGVAFVVVGGGILVYCFVFKPRNNPQANQPNVEAGQGGAAGVSSLPPAGQNLAAKTPNKNLVIPPKANTPAAANIVVKKENEKADKKDAVIEKKEEKVVIEQANAQPAGIKKDEAPKEVEKKVEKVEKNEPNKDVKEIKDVEKDKKEEVKKVEEKVVEKEVKKIEPKKETDGKKVEKEVKEMKVENKVVEKDTKKEPQEVKKEETGDKKVAEKNDKKEDLKAVEKNEKENKKVENNELNVKKKDEAKMEEQPTPGTSGLPPSATVKNASEKAKNQNASKKPSTTKADARNPYVRMDSDILESWNSAEEEEKAKQEKLKKEKGDKKKEE